jgi:cysteine desulfurase
VIYLDHAATTPVRAEVVDAMLPFLTGAFGNPSGAHTMAREARKAVDEARDELAAVLGCEPGEIVFTGSGTEADNLAVLGRHGAAPGEVVCSAMEHHAVLHPVERVGGKTVPVDGRGIVDVDALVASIGPATTLVSVMLVNNEVGTIQPLAEIAAAVRDHVPGAALHTDAVQALPWLDVAALAADADLVAVTAHKLGGPKGVGALVVRGATALEPQVLGGGQERDRRSGTHNVAGIVGFARAASLVATERAQVNLAVAALRDELARRIIATVDGVVESGVESGDRSHKIPGNLHLCFADLDSEALLFVLEREAGVCASAASACASGAQEPSHVLAAMGVSRALAKGSLRLSLGPSTTREEIERVAAALPPAVDRLRRLDR